tara:strand:- start:76 stop:255 length:180 start_codon:yes stop_codon:yes gene_type:complete
MKTIKVETIEARDENLNKNKITNQLIANIIPNLKDKAIIIPKYVATPLPPLNLSQIGKM